MASMENLFAAEPTLPSVQTSKMPDDPAQWAEMLTTKIRERYPDSGRLSVSIEFRKKDDSSGTAIGGIHLASLENQSQHIIIPFVIRKFELSPLDIWMESKSQAVHPLTNDTLKEEFFSRSTAESLDQRPADSAGQYFNDPSMWTSNYPPLQGRYSYASAGYPILDQISDTLAKDELQSFKDTLKAEPSLLIKFQKHGHQELVTKLAKKIAPATNSFVESAMKLIPVGVAHIKKESPDKYSILSIADRMFDLAAVEDISSKDIATRLSKITKDVNPVLHDLDQEGERMCVMTKAPTKGVWLYDDMTEKPESINDFAVVSVKNKSGLKIEGVVLPVVVDFAGKKKSVKLFISPDHSSMQGSVAGIRNPDSDMMKKLLGAKPARVGQTGTFVYIDDGKAIATEPVTIKSIEEYGPITAIKLDGTKIKIKRGYGDTAPSVCTDTKPEKNFLDAYGMIEVRPKEYVVPSKMHWVAMEGFQDVSATPSEYMMKEAAQHMDMDPMTVRWTGIKFQTSHSDIGINDFSERELKVVLASKGADLSKIATVIKKARAVGKVKIHGLGLLRKKADIIKEATVTAGHLATICKNLRVNLIKEAAEIDDTATVDAVLSLNFINPDNLAKFVSYKPVFKKVLDYLAELTMASRLGLKDISEGALTTAMAKIEEVCEGLSRIEAGMKGTTAKTAGVKTEALGLLTSGPLTLPASIAGYLQKHRSEKEKAEADDKTFSNLIPGVGAYRLGRRLKDSTQQKEKQEHEKKAGDMKSEMEKLKAKIKITDLPKSKHTRLAGKILKGLGAAGVLGAGAYAAKKHLDKKRLEKKANGEEMLPEEGMPPEQAAMPAEASISPAQEDHFANGMADGEAGQPLHMESARKAGAQSFLAYLNGKRTTELNQAQGQMSMGIPPKGAPKPGAKPGAKR